MSNVRVVSCVTRNKASASDRIPAELFQILKDNAIKVLIQYVSKLGKLSSGYRTGKRLVFIPIPKKGDAKECSNYHTIVLIWHAGKVMLKILQARLQQYMTWEFPDIQIGFKKGKGTRNQIANICWIIEKAREFQKNIYFCFIDYSKDFGYVDYTKLWEIL